jgi:hypothetical protein
MVSKSLSFKWFQTSSLNGSVSSTKSKEPEVLDGDPSLSLSVGR